MQHPLRHRTRAQLARQAVQAGGGRLAGLPPGTRAAPVKAAARALWALAALLALPAAGPAQPTEVRHDWSLIPSGLGPGDQFRLLFVTSTTRDASSTDIADYNDFVQDAAAAGHAAIQPYSAGFRAVASTSAEDARDNTSTTGTGVPIYWLGQGITKVADDYADFYDGSWDAEGLGGLESGAAFPACIGHSNFLDRERR